MTTSNSPRSSAVAKSRACWFEAIGTSRSAGAAMGRPPNVAISVVSSLARRLSKASTRSPSNVGVVTVPAGSLDWFIREEAAQEVAVVEQTGAAGRDVVPPRAPAGARLEQHERRDTECRPEQQEACGVAAGGPLHGAEH